jgi:hypothetical protein
MLCFLVASVWNAWQHRCVTHLYLRFIVQSGNKKSTVPHIIACYLNRKLDVVLLKC